MMWDFRTLETPPLSTNQNAVSNLDHNKHKFDKYFFKKFDTFHALSRNRFELSPSSFRQKLLPDLIYDTAEEFLKSD